MPARLDLAELSLLLIWRHLGYYLDESLQGRQPRSDRPGSKNGVDGRLKVQSLRGSLDLGNVKQNAQDAFSLVYERLDGLQIVSATDQHLVRSFSPEVLADSWSFTHRLLRKRKR